MLHATHNIKTVQNIISDSPPDKVVFSFAVLTESVFKKPQCFFVLFCHSGVFFPGKVFLVLFIHQNVFFFFKDGKNY